MKNEKIGSIEAFCLATIMILNTIILNVNKDILDNIGSSSILNVIFISIVAFIFFSIITKLFKVFPNFDLIDITEYFGGKVLKTIFAIVCFLYFCFACSIMLRDFCGSLKLIYFENIKLEYIILIFLIVSLLLNKFGFNSIVKAVLVITPIMILTIAILFFANVNKFVPERIFPILGYGAKETFLYGLQHIYAFSGIFLFAFIKPVMNNKKDFGKVGKAAIICGSVLLLLIVSSFLFTYPAITAGEDVLSIYLSTKDVEFGSFFQRADAIFILIWMISMFAFVCSSTMISKRIGKKIFNTKHDYPLVYLSLAVIYLFALIPNNIRDIKYTQSSIYKYVSIGIVFGIGLIVLICGYLKFVKNNGKKVGEIN